MINIVLGIAATLFTASLVLQIIGIWKKIPLMVFITKPFLVSLIILSYILIIKNYLPDARLLLIHQTAALTFAFVGTVLFMIENKKIFLYCGAFSFLLSILQNLVITFPSFKLYPQPLWLVLLFVLLICTIVIVFYILFFKNRKLLPAIIYFFSMTFSGIYTYSALITLIGERKLYSVLLFSGAILLMFAIFTKIKREADKKSPLLSFLSIIFCTVSQLLLAGGCILMQVL